MKAIIVAMSLIFGIPAGYALSSDLLPKDTVIQEAFKPGIGAFVGRLISVRDTSVIIHANKPEVYRAVSNLPLYKYDTLIALNAGKVSFELNDRSLITITNNTKLLIDKSIYESGSGRSTFLNMAVGKARFWVFKLANLKQTDFVIKTPTSYIGVRGSDFTVEAAEDFTKIYALDDTQLEIISLYSITKGYLEPEHNAKMYSLNSLEKVIIGKEDLVLTPKKISPEEIGVIQKEFPKVSPSLDSVRKYDIIIPTEKIETASLSVISKPEFPDADKSRRVFRQEAENIRNLTKPKGLPDYPKEPGQ